jgi:hypothetical protein
MDDDPPLWQHQKIRFQKTKETLGQVHLKLSSHFNTFLSINKLILGIPIYFLNDTFQNKFHQILILFCDLFFWVEGEGEIFNIFENIIKLVWNYKHTPMIQLTNCAAS